VAVPIKVSIDFGVWFAILPINQSLSIIVPLIVRSTNTEEGASLYSRLKSHVLPGTIVYREEVRSPKSNEQSKAGVKL
jgi:hypothetical protein